jgi:SAM-dependent methyltransferase
MRIPAGAAKTDFLYSGSELGAMEEAKRYHAWILSYFRPYVGKRVLEVGSGAGTFAERLRQASPESELFLFEPAGNLYPALEERFRSQARVHTVRASLDERAATLGVDTIVMVNVLEHIEDDGACLKLASQALAPGGHLLLFVPAVQLIYGTLDRALEHFRRYEKRALAQKLRMVGFRVRRMRYFNLPGVAAWGLYSRLLKRTTVAASDVRFYDRWVVPALSRIEGWVEPPIGQSLLAVAQVRKSVG